MRRRFALHALLIAIVLAFVSGVGCLTATAVAADAPRASGDLVVAQTASEAPNPLCFLGAPGAVACGGKAAVDQGKKAIGSAVDSAVDSGAKSLGQAMMGAWDALMKKFLTVWLDQGLLVDLQGSQVAWLQNGLRTLMVPLAVIGIMVACVWTMVNHRGDRMRQAVEALFRVFLVSTLGTAFVALMVPVGDQFGKWILDSAGVTVKGWQGEAAAQIVASQPGLAILAGIFGTLAVFIQWIIMLARVVILPLLVAVWPTTAAAAMIRGGEQAFSSVTRWIIAFILYKPAAAIVYAFAWKLKSSDDISTVINGLLLLVVAVLALPVLLRLITPAANAMGSAAGGGMALAATGAIVTAGVAAGAAVVTGGGSAAASSGAGAGAAGGGASTAGGTSAATGGGAFGGGEGAAGATGAPASGAPSAAAAPGADGADGIGDQGATGSRGRTAGGSGVREGLSQGAQSLGGSAARGAQSTDADDVLGGEQQ